MFLNLHILFTLSAANPNRDDAGSPKSVVYGGVTRSRISSQAMTRPKRVTFEASTPGERTHRSVLAGEQITGLVLKLAAESGDTLDDAAVAKLRATADKTIKLLTAKDRTNGAGRAGRGRARAAADDTATADAETENGEETAESKDTLVWLAESEFLAAARKLLTDAIAQHDLQLRAEDFLRPDRTESLAIAAFGRMFAQRPDLSLEAAIQRAHAFTTHATVAEVDYFTAVDDLRTLTKGAGHLGIAELTGGVYYWHANIDTRQLLATWTHADADDAAARLTHLFEALFLALPTGKQNTTAHHTIPALVLAAPATLPASLQAAYETPVKNEPGGGFLTPSVRALADEHARTVKALPSRFRAGRYAGTTTVGQIHGADAAESIEELAAWCAQQVLASRETRP